MKYPNRIGALIKTHLIAVAIATFVCGSANAQDQDQQAKQEEGAKPSFISPDTFQLAEGFKGELVYPVPTEFGSWVCLTTSPSGLIASDQYGKMYRITPGENADDTKVTPIPVDLGHAQGLLWAFDSLYVMSHGKEKRPGGLYRVTDSDGDGELDEFKLLRKIEGGGEHGPHAIVLSPDGKSLYVCAGNHTAVPDVQTSLVPRNWQEDNLIPRMWDPGGHAVGIMAPGGWICKTDPEGKDWELISIGYRNQYDIAFNKYGELFTYDADMEWDIGTPWYRPTRVCHVTAGSDYGWRGGDAKWPTYFPETIPPVIDIGPGSPTGIVFGTGANFPEKYKNALFIADWSFGFIYAIHMENYGASWSAEKELFCSAAALQVTDMIVHDGDLYFTIGGRRTQSALYRIVAKPFEKTAPAPMVLNNEVLKRRILESLNDTEGDFEKAWLSLDEPDRFVRYAARLQLERTPLKSWIDRDLGVNDNTALLAFLLAACRHTDAGYETGDKVLQVIEKSLAWEELDEPQRLSLLRVCGLMMLRLKNDANSDRMLKVLNDKFSNCYPAETVRLNRELCSLLTACNGNQVVEKTLDLIDMAVTQEEQIHYVMCLRTAKQGWSKSLRERYLNWFVKSAVFQGGKSFAGYLKNARDEFVGTLSETEKAELASVISVEMVEQDPYAELNAREVVKEWTVAEMLPVVETVDLTKLDIENGKRIFATAQCYKCHQFAGSGGIVGPDLTGLSRRYTSQYLLETLIDPNKEISSQYQATKFELEDGRLIVGRVANLVRDDYLVQEDMISPGKLTAVNRNDIVESKPSKISPMPEKLLDTFTQEEILDLLAYLRSADQ